MKRTVKKLRLNSDTISILEGKDLQLVNGGSDAFPTRSCRILCPITNTISKALDC